MTDLRTTNGLTKYLTEIYKIPVLSEEDEKRYAILKSQGDLNAAKMLINSHLRLVVKIAYKYKNYGIPMMDLISEGNIGLMKAVKEFDLSKECKLATYAMWWIRASIQDYILKSWSLVKIGTTVAQKKLFFNLQKIKNKIFKIDQKQLTSDNIKYISTILDVAENEVKDMDGRMTHKDVYLNKTTKDDDTTEIIELIKDSRGTPEDVVANKNERSKQMKLFQEALSILNDRERNILEKRKMTENQATLQELSKVYNVSSERVRQIEESAIKKIKDFIKSKYKM